MEFRILGPIELWSDDQRHELGRAKERLVLAILLQSPGRPVSVDKLLDYVWGDEAPAKARSNLYSYISRLRRLLGRIEENVSIDTFRHGGYILHADEQAIDLFRFRRLRRQARAISESGDEEQALDLLHQALDLWRGEPLANVSGDWVERTAGYLNAELFATTLERLEIELRLGHHTDVVTELSDLIVEHPYNETLVGHLMMALYRGGRQAEALQAYRDARDRLREALGTDPGRELQELHARILEGDRALLPIPRVRPLVTTARSTLPVDFRLFTGREEEIAALLEMASSPVAGDTAHSTVIVIDGMAGVGKTVLSVHLAHRLAGEYPDAQVYIDLRGYDADHEAISPEAALDTLLQMLGIPAQAVPGSIEDRTAMWRLELASRRVLVVLDNAAGHEQIRPLLSSAPGCLTLVTSRRRLVGLDDVRSISLDVLPAADACRLLDRAIGPGRSTTQDDLAEVVRLCDYLPLAIQLVGNRLRNRKAWSVAALSKRLAGRRLAEIRAENRDITAVFDLSYRGLAPEVRRAFRRLGLHLGSDFTLHSAAAAAGVGLLDTDRIIEDLLDQHLLMEPTEGRYRFHGLIRDYARQLAENEDTPTTQDNTIKRQLDHYVSTALMANRLLNPHGRHIEAPFSESPDETIPINTPKQARGWFAAEYQNLLAVADYATARGSSSHMALLAHALAHYLETEGHWEQAVGLHEDAVDAWRELGDALGEAQALLDLSVVCFRTGQYGTALEHANESLEIYQAMGNLPGMADVLDHRGLIEWQRSRYRDALTSSKEALEIRRRLGDRRGEARTLDHIAIFLEFVGRYQEAADRRGLALQIHAEMDDPSGLQMSLNNQGDLMLRLGKVSAAHDYYKEAAAVVADMPRQHEAIWRNNMARIRLYTGRYDEALDGFRYALMVYRQIGDRRNEVETLIEIGMTYFRMGKREEALVHYDSSYVISCLISERFEQTKALRRIGDVFLSDGRLTEALEYFQQAIDLARDTGEPFEEAKALEGIGLIYLHTRGRYQARRCWKAALRFYQRSAMSLEAEHVRALLRDPSASDS